jgi:hypothetical protein
MMRALCVRPQNENIDVVFTDIFGVTIYQYPLACVCVGNAAYLCTVKCPSLLLESNNCGMPPYEPTLYCTRGPVLGRLYLLPCRISNNNTIRSKHDKVREAEESTEVV